jgi:hypothetical protein
MVDSEEVDCAVIAQSDVKGMYTEISHANTDSCVESNFPRWVDSGKSTTFIIIKHDRCGVSTGASKDPKKAVTISPAKSKRHPAYELHCIALASKGLGWAGGSPFELGMSFSLPLEPELAPCGWRCSQRRLTIMRPFGNGYELHHAYIKMGCAHLLIQGIGVTMGSTDGPVLAWSVCIMHSENAFHRSLVRGRHKGA